MLFTVTLVAAAFGSFVLAHPGEAHVEPSPAELTRRHHSAVTRSSIASNCGAQVAARHRSRMAKRSLGPAHQKRDVATDSVAAQSAMYPTIQNTTCVLAPEVTEGPYYTRNELVRTDLREDQEGIDLILDIGIIDINTCEPLNNAYVELWNCNAIGEYSGYTTSGTSGSGGGAAPSGGSAGGPAPSGAMPSGAVPSAASTKQKRQGMSTSMTDQYTFLRGGYPTSSDGVVELTTIFPGFYTGRTVHTHVMVHTNYSINDDGTINDDTGNVVHIGQIFYSEDILTQVLSTTPYSNTTQTRTYNSEDSILAQENSAGNNAYAETSLLGSSIQDGVLGLTTIGVDTTFNGSITTTNSATSIDSAFRSSALAALTAATQGAASGSQSASAVSTATSSASGSVNVNSDSTTSATSFGHKLGMQFGALVGPVLAAAAFHARG